MRINFWMGVRTTLPTLKKFLEDETRICEPFLPSFHSARSERLVDTIKQYQKFSPINQFIWYNVDRQEANLAVHKLSLERNPIRLFYKFSPPGSRFYFYKIEKEEELRKFKYFVKNLADDRWLLKIFEIRKDQVHQLSEQDIEEKYQLHSERVNIFADEFEATPWEDFNLKDYFNDGVDNPTEIKVRVKVKI